MAEINPNFATKFRCEVCGNTRDAQNISRVPVKPKNPKYSDYNVVVKVCNDNTNCIDSVERVVEARLIARSKGIGS